MSADPSMRAPHQNGFTLIEAIVVIVITAIVGGAVAVFMRLPVQGYVDTVARAALTDLADTAMQRMKRDIRLALPNSLRIDDSAANGVVYLEFLETKSGGRYLADDDGMAESVSVQWLNWTDPDAKSFTVVGSMPTGRQAILAGDYLVVYNMGADQEPANAYNCDVLTPCNRALIESIAGNLMTMKANPFAAQDIPMQSPTKRFQVVTSAVTYVCDPGRHTLKRYWNYQIIKNQPTTTLLLETPDTNKPSNLADVAKAPSALLANDVNQCQFDAESLVNAHSGLVTLTLEFGSANTKRGVVKLVQQIHVDNTP